MFNRRTVASVIAGAALLLATSSFAQYSERTIKWTNGVNEDHSVSVGVRKMQELLNARTGGKMKINAFWGGAAGGDLAGAQAARAGTQEIVCTSGSPEFDSSRPLLRFSEDGFEYSCGSSGGCAESLVVARFVG